MERALKPLQPWPVIWWHTHKQAAIFSYVNRCTVGCRADSLLRVLIDSDDFLKYVICCLQVFTIGRFLLSTFCWAAAKYHGWQLNLTCTPSHCQFFELGSHCTEWLTHCWASHESWHKLHPPGGRLIPLPFYHGHRLLSAWRRWPSWMRHWS